MVSKLALGAIWGYQRYLSPRKGFRCAYSALHGGTGCSGYAKYAIRDHGLWQAIPEILQRLRDCKEASASLRANCAVHSERPLEEDEREELERLRRKDRWYNRCDTCTGPCECVSAPTACLGSATSRRAAAPSSKGCGDANPCDGDVCGCDCSPSCT